MSDIAITSIDNPYDPFREWDLWLNHDLQKGKLSCCSMLASFAASSDNFDDEAEDLANELAINDIVNTYSAMGYIKVKNTPSGMEVVSPSELIYENIYE